MTTNLGNFNIFQVYLHTKNQLDKAVQLGKLGMGLGLGLVTAIRGMLSLRNKNVYQAVGVLSISKKKEPNAPTTTKNTRPFYNSH